MLEISPPLIKDTPLGDAEEWWMVIAAAVVENKVTDIFFSRGHLFARHKGRVRTLVNGLVPSHIYKKMMDVVIPSSVHAEELMSAAGSTDFAFSVAGVRFRGNFYRDSQGFSGACRPLPSRAFSADEIGLSSKILDFVGQLSRGLVLVTGPTGSGKSSTLCTMIEHLNQTKQYSIVTIEDPIEYIFTPASCIIHQREVGTHVSTFSAALRAAMRQAPNVIFVGEMRDFETVMTALQAAETGHIVFSTLHTHRVYATISRIIDIAPENMKDEIRANLAGCLQMIIGQRLLPKKDNSGMVAAREVFINTPAGESKIRGGKEKTLSDVMISGRDKGMVEWDMALKTLFRDGVISEKDYLSQTDATV